MTVANTPQVSSAGVNVSTLVRVVRMIYLIGTTLLVGAVMLQVFFAGAALLVDLSFLAQHRSLAHLMELLIFVIPIVALFARLPRRVVLLSWLLLVAFMLQYVFLYALRPMGLPPSLRALHAVNALVIFWITVYLTQAVWRLVRATSGSAR